MVSQLHLNLVCFPEAIIAYKHHCQEQAPISDTHAPDSCFLTTGLNHTALVFKDLTPLSVSLVSLTDGYNMLRRNNYCSKKSI